METEKVDWESNQEIKYFREYLRIPSVHPNVDYAPCVAFLQRQADDIGLPMEVHYPANQENPVVIISWIGAQPQFMSILLNSHMDVVPVYADKWTYPPFDAQMNKEGHIYARGTQDTKSVGMQYLAAIRALKKSGVRFLRTIYICFVPDEENGSVFGMKAFVQTDAFKALRVGFALDEGMASMSDIYPVYYGERSIWRPHFTITGESGHGSLLPKFTAGEKLSYILKNLMDMRLEQVYRLQNNPELSIGDVTSINLTCACGGIHSNIIPPTMGVCYDMRLALTENHEEFEAKLKDICERAGGGIKIDYEAKSPPIASTAIDETNIFWTAFNRGTDESNVQINAQIFPGGTDSRFLRELGIPALGFSPMNNTPPLLHGHDEYIGADTFLRGIEIYKIIIPHLANMTKCTCTKPPAKK